MPNKPLGQSLLAMLDDINTLLQKTNDPQEIKQILVQRDRLNQQITDVVDATLDRESAEYQQATAALDAAGMAVQKTLNDLEAVVRAISAVASAIDEVATLLPA